MSQRIPWRVRAAFKALVVAFAVLCIVTVAKAEKRVALVVGNGDYSSALKLPNPARDAVAVSELFRNLGFEVVTGTDLSREQMAAKLGEFAKMAENADAAVFFYAGHGIAVDGKNYLIPIDADLKTEMDVKLGAAIDADVALQQTLSTAKVKIVFLDACRDNPFAKQIASAAPASRGMVVTSGLAEMKPGEGTLIAFATGPGEVALDGSGNNSPFTSAILQNLANPGVEIRQAMTMVRAQVNLETGKKQLPWENTNLTGFFYMNPTPAGTQVAIIDPGAPGQVLAANEIELEFWKTVKESNSPEELNAYLVRYPSGVFASVARSRIASLQNAAAPASDAGPAAAPAFIPDPAIRTAEASQASEDVLGLGQVARSAAQKKLTALGFPTGGTNGKFGGKTRIGVAGWQAARGYPATGYFNKLQHEALMAEAAPIAAETADKPRVRSTGVKSKVHSTAVKSKKPSKVAVSAKKPKAVVRRRSTASQAGEFIGGVMRRAAAF